MKFSRYIFWMFPSSGDNEIRTRDPLLARQVLSQLSYIPRPHKMGSSGLEPPTSRLSGVRSNQLSYEPSVENTRFELVTSCLQGRRSPN